MQEKRKDKLINQLQKFHGCNKTLREQIIDLMKSLEELNKKLQEAESLKSNFLSNVRNEINNPLTTIMGLSEQIINGLHPETDSLLQCALMIYTEAFNLDFQLRNIFTAAELEAGETNLSIANVDVDALIRSTINTFRHEAEKKGITINYSYESKYENERKNLLKTDPEKLKLIISNLLSNAIEFSHVNGEVEIVANLDENHLFLSIKDYGIGIDEDDQNIIFDRFRQLDTGMTRKHKGHGLGLSITKDLIALLGGTIKVTSKKGGGSVFTITVPNSEIPVEVETFSNDGNILVF